MLPVQKNNAHITQLVITLLHNEEGLIKFFYGRETH